MRRRDSEGLKDEALLNEICRREEAAALKTLSSTGREHLSRCRVTRSEQVRAGQGRSGQSRSELGDAFVVGPSEEAKFPKGSGRHGHCAAEL